MTDVFFEPSEVYCGSGAVQRSWKSQIDMSRTKNGIVYLVGDGIQYADIAGSFLIDAMGLDGIGAAGIRIVDNFKKVGVHYIVRIHD